MYLFSSHVGVPGKSAGVIFTPVNTEIVTFAPELVGGQCCVKLYTFRNILVNAYVYCNLYTYLQVYLTPPRDMRVGLWTEHCRFYL